MPVVVISLQPERVSPSPDSKGYGVTSDVWSFGITMVIVPSLFTLQQQIHII